jgi:hypothetical protein
MSKNRIINMNTDQKLEIITDALIETIIAVELILVNLSSEPNDVQSPDRHRMEKIANSFPELLDRLMEIS